MEVGSRSRPGRVAIADLTCKGGGGLSLVVGEAALFEDMVVVLEDGGTGWY